MISVKEHIIFKVNAALGIFENEHEEHMARLLGDWIGHAQEEAETNFIDMFSKAEIEALTGVEGFEKKWDTWKAELNIRDVVRAMSSEMAQRTLDMMADQDCVTCFSSDHWGLHKDRQ